MRLAAPGPPETILICQREWRRDRSLQTTNPRRAPTFLSGATCPETCPAVSHKRRKKTAPERRLRIFCHAVT